MAKAQETATSKKTTKKAVAIMSQPFLFYIPSIL